MFFVYAVKSLVKNYIYVGQTDNVIRRFQEHNDGLEKTTRPYLPFELIFSKEYPDRTSARESEKYYKSGKGKRYLKSLKFK